MIEIQGRPTSRHPRTTPETASPRLGGSGAGVAAPRAGSVVRSAPPFHLPGEHFAAALAFFLVGALGLVWVAPDLALGLFPLPRVVVVTHLFTLGWLTTSILGALYQFLPVALQVPIRSERVAHLSFGLHVSGLVLFAGGMLTGNHGSMLPGAVLFGSGLLLFVGNLAATLRRAPERNPTWWALAAAAVFLTVTVVLGASLTGNLRWNHLEADRFLAMGIHLHVALVGWVMLVIVGVAHRLLPMFLLSHGASERPGKLAVALLAGGVTLLLLFHHGLTAPLRWTIAAALIAGTTAFLAQAALYFRHRKRPSLDPGLRLAAGGLVLLAGAVVLAPPFLVLGLEAPRLATAYVAAMIGAFSLFAAGHYYKILPFLVWFHRFGPLVGKRPLPGVADLYCSRIGNTAAVLLALGAAGLILSILAGAPGAARPAAMAFAAGAGVLGGQMFSIATRRPQ